MIGTGAFYGCDNLEDLRYGGTQQQLAQVEVHRDNDILFGKQWQLTPENTLLSLWQQQKVLIITELILHIVVISGCFILERRQRKKFLRF